MKIKNAVICAAGFGSRLGLDMPKCLVPIGKHKLIYYLLDLLKGVENVRIVVGYKEEEVIDYVKSIRDDVVFVRNPQYASTSNSYSLHLGSKDIQDGFLTIDGDMIISHTNYNKFVEACIEGEDLIGLTPAKTDDAVFVAINDKEEAVEFSREKISNLEWCGVAYFANIKMTEVQNYVYQQFLDKLPLKTSVIDCWEIDTPNDLNLALNEIDFID